MNLPGTIEIDMDLDAISRVADLDAISRGEDVATMFLTDGIQWLADYFKLLVPLEDATQDPAAGAGGRFPLLDVTEDPASQARAARISVPAGNSVGGPPLETATQDPAATARDETFGGVSGSRFDVRFGGNGHRRCNTRAAVYRDARGTPDPASQPVASHDRAIAAANEVT